MGPQAARPAPPARGAPSARLCDTRAMAEPARKLKHTFAEYLALEAASGTRHEYLDGEIFDMAGGTIEHGALAANTIGELLGALRGRPCRVLTSDVRVRVLATGLGTYPDVSVVCGAIEHDPEDANTVVNPTVIVEVLSDSTEAYDRGEKFAHYRRLPSLRDYLLVSQHGPQVELYRRNDDDTWTLRDVRPPESVQLSIGCALSVVELYRNPLAAA
jgi:Uma2 family endonuclease